MATTTQNYKLKKPSLDDFYDVEVFNDNMDIIDEELKKASEAAEKMTPEELGVYGYIDTIGSDADLNSYLTTGSYRCTSTDAATVKNSPITNMAFQLHVFKAASEESSAESTRPTIQLLTAVNTNDYKLFWRKHSSGAWTPWEEFANASDRNIKTYTTLEQLGLDTTATIQDIFTTLPNGSELLLDVATHNASLYPLSQGTAHFTKRFAYRAYVEFYDYYGSAALNRIKRYYGLYNSATGFSGWQQYYDSFNLPPGSSVVDISNDFISSNYAGVTITKKQVYKQGNMIFGYIEFSGTITNDVLIFHIKKGYYPLANCLATTDLFANNTHTTSGNILIRSAGRIDRGTGTPSSVDSGKFSFCYMCE